jgi:hypothetical protein
MNTLTHPDAEELAKFFSRFQRLTGFHPLSTEARRHCRALLAGKLIVITQTGPIVTMNAMPDRKPLKPKV